MSLFARNVLAAILSVVFVALVVGATLGACQGVYLLTGSTAAGLVTGGVCIVLLMAAFMTWCES